MPPRKRAVDEDYQPSDDDIVQCKSHGKHLESSANSRHSALSSTNVHQSGLQRQELDEIVQTLVGTAKFGGTLLETIHGIGNEEPIRGLPTVRTVQRRMLARLHVVLPVAARKHRRWRISHSLCFREACPPEDVGVLGTSLPGKRLGLGG